MQMVCDEAAAWTDADDAANAVGLLSKLKHDRRRRQEVLGRLSAGASAGVQVVLV